jgi:hypothetical protein
LRYKHLRDARGFCGRDASRRCRLGGRGTQPDDCATACQQHPCPSQCLLHCFSPRIAMRPHSTSGCARERTERPRLPPAPFQVRESDLRTQQCRCHS